MCGLCPVLTWTWLNYYPSFEGLSFTASSAAEVRSQVDENQSATEDITYRRNESDLLLGPALNYVRISKIVREWLPILAKVWIVGVFYLSLRLGYDYFHLKKLTTSRYSVAGERHGRQLSQLAERMGIRHAVTLVESALVEIPAVVGWFKPVVIVPVAFLTALPPEQIEVILAHELAHVKRHDYCVNILQLVIETVLFYHPAVWWIGRSIREERENCCDDIAISVGGDKVIYVSALASLAQTRSSPNMAALAADGGSLLRRVRRVFGTCDNVPFSFIKILRESYEATVLGVVSVCMFGVLCFAINRGSVTRHVDSTCLAKALVAAAADNRLVEMECLLRQGANPDLNVRPNGENALYSATRHNRVEAIGLLLRHGAHVDDKNNAGFRAIDWALATGNLAIVSLLRDNGAAISSAEWAGATGDLAVLQALIKNGALKKGVADQVLKVAVSMGQLKAVKFLENTNGKPVAGRFLSDAVGSGNVLMMEYIARQRTFTKADVENAMDQAVVFYDQPEAAKFLLLKGANPNKFTRWGRYILSEAKSDEMIKILLEAGANPNVEDMLGSPVTTAPDAESVRLLLKYGLDLDRIKGGKSSVVEDVIDRYFLDRPDVVQELLKNGATLDLQNNGVGALAMAARRNDLKTMKLLLDMGVIPNAFASEPRLQSSPLRIAALVSSLDAVKFLLERGDYASGNPRDDSTPLSLALLSGDRDMTDLLRRAGARDVGPLSIAAAFGDLGKVSDLIERGANVNESDRDGLTPLFYAIQRDHPAVVRLLLQHGAGALNATSQKI